MKNKTVKELKLIAKELKIKYYYKMNKLELIKAIEETNNKYEVITEKGANNIIKSINDCLKRAKYDLDIYNIADRFYNLERMDGYRRSLLQKEILHLLKVNFEVIENKYHERYITVYGVKGTPASKSLLYYMEKNNLKVYPNYPFYEPFKDIVGGSKNNGLKMEMEAYSYNLLSNLIWLNNNNNRYYY